MKRNRTPYDAALARSKENVNARPTPHSEGGGGVCWPQITPSFQFDPSTKIFTIGSCFARNIETHLIARGFDVRSFPETHGIRQIAGHLGAADLNKYTPATIQQELEWARTILDRDDTVQDSDVEKLMIRIGDDVFVDTQLHGMPADTFDRVLKRRQDIYRIYREAFSADVVIITLGLIEAWWDDELQIYLQGWPTPRIARQKDRFFFERLNYEQSLTHTRAALDLLERGHRPNVLLTTSPVSLLRTFTSEDVRVANTYSKSVLRSVCGQIVEERDNVDYFPSYESVTLTRQDEIWQDDLVHVAPTFVSQIMDRVCAAYLQDDAIFDHALEETLNLFSGAIVKRDYSTAYEILSEIPEAQSIASPGFRLAAAQLMLTLHKLSEIEPFLGLNGLALPGPFQVGDIAVIKGCLEGLNRRDLASKLEEDLTRFQPLLPIALIHALDELVKRGFPAQAAELLASSNPETIAHSTSSYPYIQHCDQLGRPDLADEMLVHRARFDLLEPAQQAKLATRLSKHGNVQAAADHIVLAAQKSEFEGQYRWLCVDLLEKAGRGVDALDILERFVERAQKDGDADGLVKSQNLQRRLKKAAAVG